jgi:hypothetical protein
VPSVLDLEDADLVAQRVPVLVWKLSKAETRTPRDSRRFFWSRASCAAPGVLEKRIATCLAGASSSGTAVVASTNGSSRLILKKYALPRCVSR